MTDKCEELQKELDVYLDREDSEGYSADIEDFINDRDLNYQETVNTYNYDNIISQVIQYTIIEDEEDDYYIILQVHGGCDVRGGYTRPRVLYMGSDDNLAYFICAQSNISLWCDKCELSWYSDDSGYKWYADDSETPELEVVIKEGVVTHKKCGGKLEFSVTESW